MVIDLYLRMTGQPYRMVVGHLDKRGNILPQKEDPNSDNKIDGIAALNREQLEAARMDGANHLQQLRYMILPHLGRSVAVVVMIELIFLLSVFAEIYTTTGGGPGDASTNVAFLIFKQALLNFDAGVASAGALASRSRLDSSVSIKYKRVCATSGRSSDQRVRCGTSLEFHQRSACAIKEGKRVASGSQAKPRCRCKLRPIQYS